MKKTKKAKKPNIPRLKRKAMLLWSKKVRAAYGNKCCVCGSEKMINSHHIESRHNSATRFSLENGIALCPLHHKFGLDSAHQSPIWFHDWLLRHRPGTVDWIYTHRTGKPEETAEYVFAVIEKLKLPPTSTELDVMGLLRFAGSRESHYPPAAD